MLDRLVKWIRKSHPVILGITITTLIMFTLSLATFLALGYRFAVFENVRPDWEAIGTVFSFISATGAIGAAVFIPWQISRKQNRIALFDMKFEVFQRFSDFVSLWGPSLKRILEENDEKQRLFACLDVAENLLSSNKKIDEMIQRYFLVDCKMKMDT